MWDDPRLLNRAADALYLAAAVLGAALVWHAMINAPYLPVRTVNLVGDVAHVDPDAVHGQLTGRVTGNFFGLDLDEVGRLVGELPRVRRVEVRRSWPDAIVVRIEEHVPIARWSDAALVSAEGDLFDGEAGGTLPRLGGPAGSAREVALRYLAIRSLVAPLGVEPVEVELSARYAWRARLSNGMTLELGRDDARSPIEERLARFVAAYPRAISSLNRRVEYVDLRYPNGFAVRVPEQQAAEEPPRRRGQAHETRNR